MAATSFTCPKCAAKARSNRDIPDGAMVKCPRCAHVFRFESGASGIAEVLPVTPPPARGTPPARRAEPPTGRDEPRPRRRPEPDVDEREERPRAHIRRDDPEEDDWPRRRPRYEDDDRPRSRRGDWDDDDDRPARLRKPRPKRSRIPGLILLGVFLVALVTVTAGVIHYAWKSGQGNPVVGFIGPPPMAQPWAGAANVGLPRGFGGEITTTGLRQPADDGAAGGPLVRDVTSIFAEPLVAGRKERRLVGPPPRAVEGAAAPADPGRGLSQPILTRVKKATTMIRVVGADGREGSGSGFFVGPDLVMTNAHVVGMLAPETPAPKKLEAVVNSGEADKLICSAKVLSVERQHDLALLRVTPPAGAKLPEALPVAGGSKLFETQPVFIFGFPLGRQLGEAITVSESRVSSLRRDADGVLDRVQVNGGMHPGNSGGPVVDSAGNVVGVSVAVIRDTTINFAVPAERVSALLEGQLAGIRSIESAAPGGGRSLVVTVKANDPLTKIRAVSLDWWWGEPGPKAGAGRGKPPAQPGRQTLTMIAGANGEYTASVPLTVGPPDGQVLWLQPRHRDAAGNELYYQGVFTEVYSALEARPVRLTYRPRRGPSRLALKVGNMVRFNSVDGDTHSLNVQITSLLREERLGQADDQSWVFRLGFDKLDVGVELDDRPAPRGLAAGDHLEQLSKARIELRAGSGGKITGGRTVVDDAPDEARNVLGLFAHQLARTVELTSVNVESTQDIQPGQKWATHYQSSMITPQGEQDLLIDMQHTYLGVRRVHGREMAELALSGDVKESAVQPESLGKVKGTVWLDLKTGVVTKADISVESTMELVFLADQGKASSTLEIKLQRE